MVHYLELGGQERPVCFSYAVAYEYETRTGKYYLPDVEALAGQIIQAGAALGTDDIGAASRHISMVKFVDIVHACLLVGYRKQNRVVDFGVYDVAEWLQGNLDTVEKFTTLLLEANFDLSGNNEKPEAAEPAKKKQRHHKR